MHIFQCIGPFTLAKTKIKKPWVFWQEKRMREKPRISYWFFGKWCACATSLYLWPYVVRSTSRVIPQKVTSHVTKNKNNTGERGASVYIGQKTDKPAEFQKTTLRRWVFRFGFFAVFKGSCLATSNDKQECEKNSGFFMPLLSIHIFPKVQFPFILIWQGIFSDNMLLWYLFPTALC